MSNKITVENDMSLAQENAALRNKVAVLEEQLSLVQEQFEWLMSGQCITPSIRKTKPTKML